MGAAAHWGERMYPRWGLVNERERTSENDQERSRSGRRTRKGSRRKARRMILGSVRRGDGARGSAPGLVNHGARSQTAEMFDLAVDLDEQVSHICNSKNNNRGALGGA